MKKYKVAITVRNIGAKGILYRIVDFVSVDPRIPENDMTVRIELSKKYEHISGIKFLEDNEK